LEARSFYDDSRPQESYFCEHRISSEFPIPNPCHNTEMPPRFAYWTILIDNTPTAFRARERQELLPTLTQLKRTNPNVELKWFAQGRLWDSQEAQRESWQKPQVGERRNKDWRPGGDHKDPRAKFDKEAQRRKRREMRAERDKLGGPPRSDRPWSNKPPGRPPGGDRPWQTKPTGPRAERIPWQHKPTGGPPRPPSQRYGGAGGDRPWSNKPPRDGQKPWAGKSRGDRPWSKPPSDRHPHDTRLPRPPSQGSSAPGRSSPKGQASGGGWQAKPTGPRGERKPWQNKPTGPRAERKPWQNKPIGPRAEQKPWQNKPAGGPPRGDRPRSDKPPRDRAWSGKPRDGQKPWAGKPRTPSQGSGGAGGDRSWSSKPPGDGPRKPFQPRPEGHTPPRDQRPSNDGLPRRSSPGDQASGGGRRDDEPPDHE
jgi:23S rRNA pseudouridine2605 synthase